MLATKRATPKESASPNYVRSLSATDIVETIFEQENNRLAEAEVWVRGTLSYLGLLTTDL